MFLCHMHAYRYLLLVLILVGTFTNNLTEKVCYSVRDMIRQSSKGLVRSYLSAGTCQAQISGPIRFMGFTEFSLRYRVLRYLLILITFVLQFRSVTNRHILRRIRWNISDLQHVDISYNYRQVSNTTLNSSISGQLSSTVHIMLLQDSVH